MSGRRLQQEQRLRTRKERALHLVDLVHNAERAVCDALQCDEVEDGAHGPLPSALAARGEDLHGKAAAAAASASAEARDVRSGTMEPGEGLY